MFFVAVDVVVLFYYCCLGGVVFVTTTRLMTDGADNVGNVDLYFFLLEARIVSLLRSNLPI